MLQAAVRDLLHAAHSLARTRSFTVVVVASLGIGMGTFVALVTFMRGMTAPVSGVKTDGLVELLVTPIGPLRARAGNWAIEEWSYPDFAELRDAETGIAVTGWAIGESRQSKVRGNRAGQCADDVRLGELLQHDRRFVIARTGIRSGRR